METISIAELEAARAVGKSGSLAAAARELHRTPAAIHKQMKQLEAALGVPLYSKVGRNIRLSGAMELLLPYTESVLEQVAAARRAVEEWSGLRSGIVRIGTGPTMSSHWLPRIITAFRARHPDVQLNIDTGTTAELLERIRRGHLDLAIVLKQGHEAPGDWQQLANWKCPTVLVSGSKTLCKAESLEALREAPFLHYRTATRMATHVDAYFAKHRHVPNTIVRCDNADALRALLRAGHGYALLPSWTVQTERGASRIAPIRIRETPPALGVEMVAARSQPLSPAAIAFAGVARTFRFS